ncbi:MAG TPA: glutaminase [Caulobacteraceae bacterium]|nr:glutaminase [Caulobacteraceae bacterium]
MKPVRDLAEAIQVVFEDMQSHLGAGRVADYIPALARVDPRNFAIAAADCDGHVHTAGEAATPFSIQSISKVFTLTLALEQMGADLWRRVGREPSGSRFNSMVRLEQEHGIPRNPLINAGALVVSDALMTEGDPAATIDRIAGFLRRLSRDEGVDIDPEVARSEGETGFVNASLANFIKASHNLNNDVAKVLEVYFHQCALRMSCAQLARAGLYLAADGVDPWTCERITTSVRARRINAIMMTCGHYDASGEFAFRVGLPGKSGVGGGILAIAPRRASIAVWSPGLNPAGTSHVGALALERLAQLMDWSVF